MRASQGNLRVGSEAGSLRWASRLAFCFAFLKPPGDLLCSPDGEPQERVSIGQRRLDTEAQSYLILQLGKLRLRDEVAYPGSANQEPDPHLVPTTRRRDTPRPSSRFPHLPLNDNPHSLLQLRASVRPSVRALHRTGGERKGTCRRIFNPRVETKQKECFSFIQDH